MDKTDSTLIEAPLLDEVVGTGPELGDITQLKAEDAPELGDLSSVEEPPILEADEAIPVLSELITPVAPQETTSGLAEPDSGLRSFLDSSLDHAANQEAETAAPPEPLGNALDELLGDLPEGDVEEGPVADTDETTAPPSEAVETSPQPEAPEALAAETGEEEDVALEAPPPEASEIEATEPPTESDDPLGDALDALLGDEDTDAPSAEPEPASAFVEHAAAPAPEAAKDAAEAPATTDEPPLDLLGAAATAGASALPALRARLQEHLTHRVDDILSETVAVLVQELETQIVERVEQVLMESLEAALPKLMDGFVEGLREELQPRLRAQIPILMEDLLGGDGAGEKGA